MFKVLLSDMAPGTVWIERNDTEDAIRIDSFEEVRELINKLISVSFDIFNAKQKLEEEVNADKQRRKEVDPGESTGSPRVHNGPSETSGGDRSA